jgi:hypothetical protein
VSAFWVGIKAKERQVDVLEHAVEEEEVSTTVWIFNSEVFLLNSQKQHFLQNVEGYLPRIIFWFCLVYAVQLGLRFVVQTVAGTDEKTHIEAILAKNSQIYRFFSKLWKILLSIYRDGMETNKGFIGKTLLHQIYASLLEMENLHRGEQMTLPQVNIKLLQFWGAIHRCFRNQVRRRN